MRSLHLLKQLTGCRKLVLKVIRYVPFNLHVVCVITMVEDIKCFSFPLSTLEKMNIAHIYFAGLSSWGNAWLPFESN